MYSNEDLSNVTKCYWDMRLVLQLIAMLCPIVGLNCQTKDSVIIIPMFTKHKIVFYFCRIFDPSVGVSALSTCSPFDIDPMLSTAHYNCVKLRHWIKSIDSRVFSIGLEARDSGNNSFIHPYTGWERVCVLRALRSLFPHFIALIFHWVLVLLSYQKPAHKTHAQNANVLWIGNCYDPLLVSSFGWQTSLNFI